MNLPSAVIVSAVRTPIGRFMGALSTISAPKLGSKAIETALRASKIDPTSIDYCIMGQVLTAGSGQAPARQAAIYAELPPSTPCMTINKVCGSGLQAIMLAADKIALKECEVVIAGGQESMSNAPHLLFNSRQGLRMGPGKLIDSMVHDGLWDPYNNWHMGQAAELCVREKNISREEQDDFAKESYQRAQKATQNGDFKEELFPISIQGKNGETTVDTDEEPFQTQFDKIPKLKPVFEKEGTITAANASKLNDGAAAVIVMNETKARAQGIQPLAKIVAHSTFAQDPKWFTTAPVGAIERVLKKAGLKIQDIDLFEINEAFAAVAIAAIKDLNLSRNQVNISGGAIALGHPIGASGARILTTLIHTLKKQNKKRGLATLCIGGGEAVAMIVEAL